MTKWFVPKVFAPQSVNESSRIKEVPISIGPLQQHELRNLAVAGYPLEVCGVIHEHGIVTVLPNVFVGDHKLGFDMEFDIQDPGLRYIWHSHPQGLQRPSLDDLPCMELATDMGYSLRWLIVTLKRVFEFEVAA